jgi:antitoxin component YwqK of YwqJK toxin-antitoxin module
MRKIIVLLALLCPLMTLFSQQLMRVENAKYFDSNHNLYNGVYQETYENGNKKLEMYLVDGEQDSTTILWFENGNINEVRSYKKGLKHGKWETYNIKGIKTAEAWYRHDKKDGIWKIWDENGVLRYEMPYSSGEKTGVWKIFDASGKVINERSYNADFK